MGRQRKPGNEHREKYVYVNSLGYARYHHPSMASPATFGKDLAKANRVAKECNLHLDGGIDQTRQILSGEHDKAKTLRHKFAHAVERFKGEYGPFLPTTIEKDRWAPGTRRQHINRINNIDEQLGHLELISIDVLQLTDTIDKLFTGDGRKQARNILIHFYRFCIGKGLHPGPNIAESVLQEPAKEKSRKAIRNLDEYLAIYNLASPFLQNAMKIAIMSLQSRKEICSMALADYRLSDTGPRLKVIRGKTATRTELAFIEIMPGRDLQLLLKHLRESAVKIGSPYFLNNVGLRHDRRQQKKKRHWAQVLPDYLSRAFSEIVMQLKDKTDLYQGYKNEELPTFHELRGFGGRLYIEAGYAEEYVQALYGHADLDMTEKYLAGNDVKFHPAPAELSVTNFQ